MTRKQMEQALDRSLATANSYINGNPNYVVYYMGRVNMYSNLLIQESIKELTSMMKENHEQVLVIFDEYKRLIS